MSVACMRLYNMYSCYLDNPKILDFIGIYFLIENLILGVEIEKYQKSEMTIL